MSENTTLPETPPEAEVVRELALDEFGQVHGVTYDNDGNVWFAHGDGDLVCVEPASGRVLKVHEKIGARAGTAFDGTHIWQIAAGAAPGELTSRSSEGLVPAHRARSPVGSGRRRRRSVLAWAGEFGNLGAAG